MTSKIWTAPVDHEKHLDFLKDVECVMKDVYGPNSGTVLFTKEGTTVRDGAYTLDSVHFNDMDSITKYFISLLKSTARKIDNIGGDGTTTTTLLTIELYKQLINHMKEINHLYMGENDTLQLLSEIKISLKELMEKVQYIPENEDDLISVAKVALNNSDVLVQPIIDMMKECKETGMNPLDLSIVVKMEESLIDSSTKYDIVNGLETLSIPQFNKVGAENVDLIYIPYPLDMEHMFQVIHILSSYTRVRAQVGSVRVANKILLMAPSIHGLLAEQLAKYREVIQRQGANVDFDIVEAIHPLQSEKMDASLDIGLALNAPSAHLTKIPIINDAGITESFIEIKGDEDVMNYPSLLNYYNGLVKHTPIVKYEVIDNRTRIVVTDSLSENMESRRLLRIKELENSLVTESNNQLKAKIQSRIDYLNGHSIILKVGGSSASERSDNYHMYVDAILHMDSAKKGIIAAGNVGMIKVISYLKHEISNGANIEVNYFLDCVLKAYKEISGYLDYSGTYNGLIEGIDIVDIDFLKDTITQGYDITKKCESSKSILASSINEQQILESVMSTIIQLFTIKRISFDNYVAYIEYVENK